MSKKVVWILGSGFSKSLGGPLLKDLLSHRGRAYQHAKFPNVPGYPIYRTYWTHLKDASESSGNPIYWDHAEEFLEFADSAAQAGSPRQGILREAVLRGGDASNHDLQAFARKAVRCVAAECLFTTHADPKTEAWRPYIRWASEDVGSEDTIVTFNYDMVLETLGAADENVVFREASVIKPNAPASGSYHGVPIYKLHGSVGWSKFGSTLGYATTSEQAAEQIEGGDIWIATPGSGKVLLQEGELQSLWRNAEQAIARADVIVFMGYRFPPSDSQARSAILGAMGRNTSKYLRVHTVLGPRTHDDDTVRLLTLLEHTLRASQRIKRDDYIHTMATPPMTFDIVPQPLYVEDFLTVIHGRELYGPPVPGG